MRIARQIFARRGYADYCEARITTGVPAYPSQELIRPRQPYLAGRSAVVRAIARLCERVPVSARRPIRPRDRATDPRDPSRHAIRAIRVPSRDPRDPRPVTRSARSASRRDPRDPRLV